MPQLIVDGMRDGLALHDRNGALVLWNDAAQAVTGWTPQAAADRFNPRLPEGLVDLGDGRWIDVRHFDVTQRNRTLRATLFSDARQQVALREAYSRLNDLVTTDPLTGLPNRVLAEDRLQLSVGLARRDARAVALLFVDLDRFKLINDTLGHHAGDQVLRQVAERLKAAVRESDTAARVGGDEFVVILHSLAQAEDAERVAHAVLATMSRSFILGDNEVYLGCSIGIALYPDHGDDPETLLQHADLAMYGAKSDGGNQARLYAAVMSEDTRERLALAAELHRGMARRELEVHYQPQIDLDSGQVVATEALVRWRHPTRGLLGPDRFLPLAEEDGSVVDIDRFVLETACAQVAEWDAAGVHIPAVAVNLSARTLVQADVVTMVSDVVARTGVTPDRLEIEVSEHVVAARADEAEGKLRLLKALGVQVAIDDFGTGYSSLGHLKRFPIDTIKLDRSFVVEIAGQPTPADIAVLRAVVAMAADLGLRCVAEGVETTAQRRLLRFLQCHLVQGFLYSPAVEARSIVALVHSRPAVAASTG